MPGQTISDSNRRLDGGVMLVSDDGEVLILVIEQGISLADFNGRVRVRVSAQLLQELVDMVVVDVAVSAIFQLLPILIMANPRLRIAFWS